VDAFAFCMAVPDSALSRAEQSVERTLSGSAPEPRGLAACARGPPWPVPSRSSMQVASRRAPGQAQRQLGARIPAPAEPSAANPATGCPPGAAERHLGRRRPGLPRGEHGPAPSCADVASQRRPPHAFHTRPRRLRKRSSRFRRSSSARLGLGGKKYETDLFSRWLMLKLGDA